MAGSWTRLTNLATAGTIGTVVIGARFRFLADASDGTLPDLTVTTESGYILGMEVTFDDTTPPNDLTIIQKTVGGTTQWSPAIFTADGYAKPDTPEAIADGFVLTATQTAAATNSATGVVTVFLG